MTKNVPFILCDVFTNIQFEGNQLAVFPDAGSLTCSEMQKIAAEFNFSECTFVFEGDGVASHHVRIFTPTHEVPFAGHPNVGTAYVLATYPQLSKLPLRFKFREAAGLVDVNVSSSDRGIFCEIQAPEPLSIGEALQPSDVSAALGLKNDEIDTDCHPPVIASVGLPFIVACVTSRVALSKAMIDMAGFHSISDNYSCSDILIYWRDPGGIIHTRVFAPLDNVPEDPATGSANGALVALLSEKEPSQESERLFKVHQGDDMGRPCRLFLRTVKNNQGGTDVYIGGQAKIVGDGNMIVEASA